MATDTSKGVDVAFYDFHGDLIPDELATTSDTGTITTNVGLSGGKAGTASILRLDNSNDGDNEMAEVDFGALNYRVQDGMMSMEARVSLERTVCAANVAFTDETTESGNTLGVELSGTTFTSTASTWCGFVCDSDATNDNWHVFWVDGDSDTDTPIATLNTGIPMQATEWITLKVTLTDRGSGNGARATFFAQTENGESWEYSANTNVSRSTALTPSVGIENRTTTGAFIDIDYIEAMKSRS